MVSVTLCMVVKDEAQTIKQTLESILPHVDQVYIVDTGSTDGTQAIVNECLMRGPTPDFVVESRPWVDYATNRTECLHLARERFGKNALHWLFMLDGHYTVGFTEPAELRDQIEVYATPLTVGMHVPYRTGNWDYEIVRLFRSDAQWEYEFPVHELPVFQGMTIPQVMGQDVGRIDGIVVEALPVERDQKAKWVREAMLIRKYLYHVPSYKGYHPRMTFYLAQTLECLGQNEEARALYLQRWEKGDGSGDETWEAGFRYAILNSIEPHPCKTLGYDCEVCDGTGEVETGIDVDLLEELAHCKPWRAEVWYQLAQYHLEVDARREALPYAMLAAALSKPGHDTFMIRDDIYRYKAEFQYAMLLLLLGRPHNLDDADTIYVNIKEHVTEAEGVAWRQQRSLSHASNR